MGIAYDLSLSQLSFVIDDSDASRFLVVRYRGVEGMSRLFRFELDLACDESQGTFDDIVGREATLSVNTPHGQRYFHGIIGRFEYVGPSVHQNIYRAEIVPKLWLLTHRYDSRIFQDLSIPDIIDKVLTGAGIPADSFRFELQDKYEPREYCVQYRETDYNYFARLAEEAGIWWYFEQTEEGHVLVLADSPAAYAPIEDDPALPFSVPTGLNAPDEHVFEFKMSQSVRPGAVSLRDFNFQNPKLNLGATVDAGRNQDLAYSDFPGEYEKQGDGQSIAQRRVEEFQAARLVGAGKSDCHRLCVGRTFVLSEHPCKDFNQAFLLTAMVHEGKQAINTTTTALNGRFGALNARLHQSLLATASNGDDKLRDLAQAALQTASRLKTGRGASNLTLQQQLYHAGRAAGDLTSNGLAGPHSNLLSGNDNGDLVDRDAPVYECQFDCIPADVAYRAPRVTPWPDMRGTQTARVVGPAGEEIYTDEYGRVKVQFHWDCSGKFDENSSCWIRVCQGMAGGQYGMMFLPRVGQEVVVDFLEGNPDSPMIIGRVYNRDHMPPYELPAEKTKSVIKTHSSRGGGGTNEIRFEDLKDSEQLLINAQKDYHLRVGNEERHTIGATQHQIVGAEQRVKIASHRSVTVEEQDALEVKQTQSIVIKGDAFHVYDSNHDHKVASEYHLAADKIVLEASSISFAAGGSFITIDSSGVTIMGSKIKLNSGGSALSSSITGSAATPALPEEADKVTPGKDDGYTQEPPKPPVVEDKPQEGQWISIDLKDRSGEPVAGESYEIVTPAGGKLYGTLDVNGFARRYVKDPGQCQINFPRLDAKEWNRR